MGSPKLRPNKSIRVAKGPDGTEGFRWNRNPDWKPTDKTPQLNPDAPRFSPSAIPSLAAEPPPLAALPKAARQSNTQRVNTKISIHQKPVTKPGPYPKSMTLFEIAQGRTN